MKPALLSDPPFVFARGSLLFLCRCINYANEKLQQQFNAFVFKLEQAEYAAEQILWSFVDFPDNRECLALLEQKRVGVLAVLDEQCVLISRATDSGLAGHLYDKCGAHPSFSASAAEKRSGLFVVAHYAGEVGQQAPPLSVFVCVCVPLGSLAPLVISTIHSLADPIPSFFLTFFFLSRFSFCVSSRRRRCATTRRAFWRRTWTG